MEVLPMTMTTTIIHNAVTIPGDQIVRAAMVVLPVLKSSKKTDPYSPILTAARLTVTASSAVLVGTNRYYIAEHVSKLENADPFTTVLPFEAVQYLAGLKLKDFDPVTITIAAEDETLRVTTPTATVEYAVPEGNFPPLDKIIDAFEPTAPGASDAPAVTQFDAALIAEIAGIVKKLKTYARAMPGMRFTTDRRSTPTISRPYLVEPTNVSLDGGESVRFFVQPQKALR